MISATIASVSTLENGEISGMVLTFEGEGSPVSFSSPVLDPGRGMVAGEKDEVVTLFPAPDGIGEGYTPVAAEDLVGKTVELALPEV